MNRGDVYWINLDPTQGSEIKKTRPCVIVSADPINRGRKTVIVVPLSTQASVHSPITISVRCMNKEVVAICDQIRAVDKSRLTNFIEKINQQDIAKIEHSLKVILVV